MAMLSELHRQACEELGENATDENLQAWLTGYLSAKASVLKQIKQGGMTALLIEAQMSERDHRDD